MFGLTALETKLAGALILILLLGVGYGLWAHHERTLGEAQIVAADAKALADAKQKAAAESAQLQAGVNEAHQETKNVQAQFDAYSAAHPIGPVRVCVASSGQHSVPRTADTSRGTEDTSTPAGAVPSVPEPVAGPDISRGFTVIVSAAARLAVLEHEHQQVEAAHE